MDYLTTIPIVNLCRAMGIPMPIGYQLTVALNGFYAWVLGETREFKRLR
jgi:hypothetical protein